MSSKFSVNIKYPDIVVPDTDADTPDTGMFSVSHSDMANYTSNLTAPIIGVSILAVMAVALVLGIIKSRKSRKSNTFSIHTRGSALLRFAGLFAIILIAAFSLVRYNEEQDNIVNATGTNTDTELSITTEDINIDVELNDKPVFASTKSTVTVDTATTNGYTLMAYIDNNATDLTNKTNTKATTRIAGLESLYSQSLAENTWGVAFSLPENQDAPVFHGLPTSREDAMTIKVTGSTTTPANDATELYYATYVTPDLEEGTYVGPTINYVAVANPADEDITVRYNRINSNGSGYDLFNTVTYGLDCSMAYIGGNCQKVYVGEGTTVLATDGAIGDIPVNEYFSYNVSLVPITYDGADAVKIKVDFRDEANEIAVVIKGAYSDVESLIAKMQEMEAAGDDVNGLVVYSVNSKNSYINKEFSVGGDALTIISVPRSDTGYDGFIYDVAPVYVNKPSGINTTETTVCALVDSSEAIGEVDDDFYYFGSSRSVTIPGADGIRVEITYNLPLYDDREYLELDIIEGGLNIFSDSAKDHQIASYNGELSDTKIIDFDGDMVTFRFSGYYPYEEGNNHDYGFSAKIYPIYNDDAEDLVPAQTCRVLEKSGTYKALPNVSASCIYWGPINTFDYSGMTAPFLRDGLDFQSWLYLNYDYLKGRTLDFVAGNSCMV